MYSKACTYVNSKPHKMVINKALKESTKFLFKKILCDQVRLKPEDNKIAVFSKGISEKDMYLRPTGGQILPIHIDGARLT